MDFTPGQKTLLAFWGSIQSAVSQRASTADLWAAVRAAADAEGASLGGASAIDLGQLRSIAASQRNAMEDFSRARITDPLTSDLIAQDVSARGLQEQNLAPRFIVRFEHDVTVEGQLQTLWRSSIFEGSLPATKSDLMNAVEGDAQALADDYDVTHIGIGRIQISAV